MDSGLRKLIATLISAGLAFFTIGLVGDLFDWWDKLGFVSNVIAGTTGACFGIPFAVVVLQRVLRSEQDLRERRERVQRLSNVLDDLRTYSTGVPDLDDLAN